MLLLGCARGEVCADTSYTAIGKFQIEIEPIGTCETAALVARVDSAFTTVRLVTLDPDDGSQLGQAATVWMPPGACMPDEVVRILFSRSFLPNYLLILDRKLNLGILPVTIAADGTPIASSWSCAPAWFDTADVGYATAFTEMPGAAFPDGKPRLVIGTGSGRLLVVVRDHRGLIVAERVHTIAGGAPINDVGPLPQAGGVLLGVAAGAHLYGLQDVSSLAQERFRLMHPGGLPVRSFRSFEPDTMALEASDPYAHIAFCDGLTERLYFARVPASAAGGGVLDTVSNTTVYSDMGADASTITGSLLILTAGRRDVYYRPGYTTGTSVPGCRVNLAEETPEVCLSCPIEQNGDVNQSMSLNSSDVIQLVNTVFKGGAWPEPCLAAGDVNCTGQVNSSDIIYLINFVFRGADPPCNVCALFAGTWDCP